MFISYLQNRDSERVFIDIVDALLRRAQAGESIIVISTLVLAEVRPRDSYDQDRLDVLQDLFYTARPYVRRVAVSPRIAELASGFGSQHNNLTTPDAIHIATACVERVDVFYTNDGKKDKERRRSGELLFYDGKLGKPALKIERPSMPVNTQLVLPASDL